MKQKKEVRKFLKILNSKLLIGALIFIIFSLASVFAGNVIVQEGNINIENNLNSSGVLFVNSTSGKVGIGTSNPNWTLHLSSTTPKLVLTDTNGNTESFIDADSSVGSLNIGADEGNEVGNSIIRLRVDGVNKLQIDNLSSIGIWGSNPSSLYGLYGSRVWTDPVDNTYGTILINYPRYTITGAFTFGGFGIQNKPTIATGQINTDAVHGLYVINNRNNYNTSMDDGGNLTTLRGQTIVYGHDNTNTTSMPITNVVYGLYLSPYFESGNISNIYDIYMAGLTSGGDSLGKHYGIYQVNNATNYLNGKLGLGTTTPYAKLDVNGNVTIRTGGSAGKAMCWKADGITLGYCSSAVNSIGSCTCN